MADRFFKMQFPSELQFTYEKDPYFVPISMSSGIIPEFDFTENFPGSLNFQNGIFSKIMETLDARSPAQYSEHQTNIIFKRT